MSKRILVIEDETNWQELFKDLLYEMGYKAEVAESFKKAEAFLQNSRYDLILTDVCLDQKKFTLDCQNFLYALHHRLPALPVIAITGKRLTPPEMWSLSQSGVVDFIYKREFRVTDFRRSVQNALQKTSPTSRLNSNSCKYGVFISYSHRNKEWVQNWLLSELERADIKACIDFRDFRPGVPMLHEMERAVIQSRKTLIILTPDYFKSQPAAFETILVQAIDPAAQYRRLIPLLLEPCELPLRIRQLAYIDFTAHNDAKLQLQRLIEAIKSDPEPFLS